MEENSGRYALVDSASRTPSFSPSSNDDSVQWTYSSCLNGTQYSFTKEESNEIERNYQEGHTTEWNPPFAFTTTVHSLLKWAFYFQIEAAELNGSLYNIKRVTSNSLLTPYRLLNRDCVHSHTDWEHFEKGYLTDFIDPSKMVVLFFTSGRESDNIPPECKWVPLSRAGNVEAVANYERFKAGGQQRSSPDIPYLLNFAEAKLYYKNSEEVMKLFKVTYAWFWSSEESNEQTVTERCIITTTTSTPKFWRPYSQENSRIIEEAYINGRTFVEITVEHGVKYCIDFSQMRQYREGKQALRRPIRRVGPPFVNHSIVQVNNRYVCSIDKTYPEYWTPFDQYELITLSPDDSIFISISNLVNSTIGEHYSGKGLVPVTKVPPKSFKILNIHRVQAKNLWQPYLEKRQKMLQKDLSKAEVTLNKTKFPLNKFATINDKINEVYLFHGTSPSTVKTITQKGFDTRHISEFVSKRTSNAMFGQGVYFAENSSKANQYVPCPSCDNNAITSDPLKDKLECNCTAETIREKGGYAMVLSRVLLGDSHVCKQYFDEKYKHTCEAPLKEEGFSGRVYYDSIWAEKYGNDCEMPLNYREFIVFDLHQMYPEFVIYYERLG